MLTATAMFIENILDDWWLCGGFYVGEEDDDAVRFAKTMTHRTYGITVARP